MLPASSRSRMRSSTWSTMFPSAQNPDPRASPCRRGAPRSLRLRRGKAGGLVDLIDEVLAKPALHLLVHRHQLGDPRLLFGVGEIMDLDLAGGFDLLERLLVVLRRGLVEIVG